MNCRRRKYLFRDNYPVGIYMFKVNNGNTGAKCEVSSKLSSGVSVVNSNVFYTLI